MLMSYQNNMNNYEEKIAAKKERYEELAEKAEKKSDSLFETSRKRAEMIPFGQPILIGHHSEKRHRAFIDRNHNLMRQNIEESEKSKYYTHKAESVGTGGISSDDPEAIIKLKEKLNKLESNRNEMKTINKEAKKKGNEKPYENYIFSNLSQNIRSVKLRIEQLNKLKSQPEHKPIQGNGWKMKEDKEENRILFLFDGKPDENIRTELKSRGFKWSPYRGAWTRKLTPNARYSTKFVIQFLQTL